MVWIVLQTYSNDCTEVAGVFMTEAKADEYIFKERAKNSTILYEKERWEITF